MPNLRASVVGPIREERMPEMLEPIVVSASLCSRRLSGTANLVLRVPASMKGAQLPAAESFAKVHCGSVCGWHCDCTSNGGASFALSAGRLAAAPRAALVPLTRSGRCVRCSRFCSRFLHA